MFSRKSFLLVTVFSIFLGLAGFYATEKYFEKELHFENANENGILSKKFDNQEENLGQSLKETEKKEEDVLETSTAQKILPTTKIVYEYYYLDDNIIQKEEGVPLHFLLGLTFNDLKELYPDWSILSFSEKEVVMRKTVNEESDQHYIVGQKDGYITIFYEEEKDGTNIHEITNIPIDGLSETEKVLLNDGIYVTGEENLARILEDYGS